MGRRLTIAETKKLIKNVSGWKLDRQNKTICREYVMKNFMSAVGLINRIAKIAEKADHHPDIHLTGYRMLRVELSSHDIGGLSKKDFDEAAKINKLRADLKISQ